MHPGDRGDDERGREPGQRRLALRPHPEPHDRADRPGRDRLAAEPAVEVVGQRLGRGVAAPRVLLQALQADHLQVARAAAGCSRDGRLRRAVRGPARASRAPSRRANGARPVSSGVEDRPQAVDVGGRRDRAAAPDGLLGGHVGGRAQDRAGDGQARVGLDPLGQAEVGDVGLALGVEQDVGRLQVAVQDAALVGVVDGLGDLGDQPRGGPRVGRVARPAAWPGCRRRSASC